MTSDLSQQLLRQVGRFWNEDRPCLRHSGNDGASSLRQKRVLTEGEKREILYCNVTVVSGFSVFFSPSRCSSAFSGYESK